SSQAPTPPREGPEDASSPTWGNATLTANEGGLSKDVPLTQGKSAAPIPPAPAADHFPRKADESADRSRAQFLGLRPWGRGAGRLGEPGTLREPPGHQSAAPPKGPGASERASPDGPNLSPHGRSAANPGVPFASPLADEAASLTGTPAERLHANVLGE